MACRERVGSQSHEELQCCQRRLEYLSSRLQDLAVEIGDGQGAVWLKDNMWFLNKPALHFDDVLFSVGKICSHLVSYLTFHKSRSFMGILYEVGEILGSVRDLLLVNPRESLSVKQSQIDLFWTDCTPFLFVFENNNHLLLERKQIPTYMRALLDLVPAVIQIGICMYCAPESQLRGFDNFAETCIRLSKALVESGEFLTQAEEMEPVVVPFLRQWILYALELVQKGVKVRTDMTLSPYSPRVSDEMIKIRKGKLQERIKEKPEQTVVKSHTGLSLSQDSSIPDDVAESCLAPLKVRNSCQVRTSCQPFRWIEVAKTRVITCPNEHRKLCLEDIGLKENQKLVSDIFLLKGEQPRHWKGVKIHCPLTKMYDEVKVKLFVKVKVGENWVPRKAEHDKSFGKGHFLVFSGCEMEGFAAIEECPMTSRPIGPDGGKLLTQVDTNVEAFVPPGIMSKSTEVKMLVKPADKPRVRQYRDTCPDDFRHVKSTSSAVEINGTNSVQKSVAIKIPFNVIKDPDTKILVLRYVGDRFEVSEAETSQSSDGNIYTVNAGDEGTVLAAVDQSYNSGIAANIHKEMEVLLGKKQLCKLLIFVEAQETRNGSCDVRDVVLCIVCAEKYRINEVVREKSKVGLIELPKSQSTDRLLKQADEIKVEIKGSVMLDKDIPEDAYKLTYLEGSDNYVRFPVKITDCNGRMTVIMRSGEDNSVLHTYFCNVQDILSLTAHGLLDTPPNSPDTVDDEAVFEPPVSGKVKHDEQEIETEVIKEDKNEASVVCGLRPVPTRSPHVYEKCIQVLSREPTVSDISQDDEVPDSSKEASMKILNRNSLVNIAKQIKNDESQLLGRCLGLKAERISRIYQSYRHSGSLATFYVLYEWRGRRTQPELADTLIGALTDIGRRDLAQIVENVRQQNRGLTAEDFAHLAQKKKRPSSYY